MSSDQSLIVCTSCAAVNRSPANAQLSQGKCGKCGTALAAPKPIDISDKIFTKLQARDQEAYVLDVWAPWCGPCKMMAPAYATSAAKFEGKVRFLKLDSEQHPQASAKLNVRGIPALFFFNHGKLVSQQSSALPETAITQWIESDYKP